jgi:hypothetical protein
MADASWNGFTFPNVLREPAFLLGAQRQRWQAWNLPEQDGEVRRSMGDAARPLTLAGYIEAEDAQAAIDTLLTAPAATTPATLTFGDWSLELCLCENVVQVGDVVTDPVSNSEIVFYTAEFVKLGPNSD